MNGLDCIKRIIEKWFLSEPLFFGVYCTHKLCAYRKMDIPFRVGKMRIEYNPEIIENLSDVMVEERLKIEMLRILLKHPYQRLPSCPNKIALSLASDITISDNYKSLAPLPTPADFNLSENLCFEEYYAKLLSDQESNIANISAFIDFDEDGKPRITLEGIDAETMVQMIGAYETSDLWEENDEAAEKINAEIEKAQMNNGWGSIPGDMISIIEANMVIKMDYRKMLNMFRASILSSSRRLTRTRPNRRYEFDYMGSQYAFTTRLLIAVDVSGSVSDKALQQFFSIINRFFKYGIESLDVLQFDCEMTDEIMSLKKARKQVKITGRGGTNFQIPMNYYEEHSEYDGLIIFTDGYAPKPEQKRYFEKILWILTSRAEYDDAISWIRDLNGSKATYIPV